MIAITLIPMEMLELGRILGKFLGLLEFFPYTDPDNSLR
jgi:hypothetical protein